jgi:hypothetical protein
MTHPGLAKLQHYALGELAAAERLVVDQHLESCARCRRLVKEEQRLDEMIVGSLGGTPSHGDEQAAFSRLWAAVDAESDLQTSELTEREKVPAGQPRLVETPESVDRRAASFWPLAVAAAALFAILWGAKEQRGGSGAVTNVVAEGSATSETAPLEDGGDWDPVDPARLELARLTAGAVLQGADEQFPFEMQAFRMACEEGLAPLRLQGWSVSALVRGLALGNDAGASGGAMRYAALDSSTYLVLARALDSEARVDDALAVLETSGVDAEASAALVKALERVAGAALEEEGLSATRGRQALEILAVGEGPRLDRAWGRLSDQFRSKLSRSRDSEQTIQWIEDVARIWPAEEAVAVLENAAEQTGLREAAASAFVRNADRLGKGAARRLDALLAREQEMPELLSWCVTASVDDVTPVLVRALEDGRLPGDILPALLSLGGTEVVVGLQGLWRDTPLVSRRTRYLDALTQLFRADAALVSSYAEMVPLESAAQLAELAAALPGDARHGLLTTALKATQGSMDLGGHRANLLVALGRLGTEDDGRELIDWVGALSPGDSVLPLAWAAAGRLAPEAAAEAWDARVGDPRLLSKVVGAASRRMDSEQQPSARILAPLSAALARAASRGPTELNALPMSQSPTMEDLP